MRIARFFELLVGLVFLVGAAMKAVNIPGFAAGIRSYHVFYDPGTLHTLAIVTVAIETLLGAALIAGIRLRGAVHAIGIALLAFFSGMIAYAWGAYGLEDCGCFGDYIKMGPAVSIAKNIVMFAMLIVPWFVSRKHEEPTRWPFTKTSAGLAAIAASVAIVVCTATFGARGSETTPIAENDSMSPALNTPDTPTGDFAGIQVTDGGQSLDLSSGTYLVAIMSATCEHCKASIGPLNELIAEPATPQIVGLMMGEESDLDQFRAETTPMFPTQRVDTMLWLKLLGDAPFPPRFVLVKDGAPVEHWDQEVPPADAFVARSTSAAPTDKELS